MSSRRVILILWGLAIAAVMAGSLFPESSPVMRQVARLQLGDKVLHVAAYIVLSFLPAIGFRDRRTGVLAGLSMVLLGIFLEFAQTFTGTRAADLNDQLANTVGVATGILAALPLRLRVF